MYHFLLTHKQNMYLNKAKTFRVFESKSPTKLCGRMGIIRKCPNKFESGVLIELNLFHLWNLFLGGEGEEEKKGMD